MTIKILPASEVRNNFALVLNGLQKEGATCFVTKNGRAVATLLPMESYERIMSELEDRLDETDETLVNEVEEARRQFKSGKSKTFRSLRR